MASSSVRQERAQHTRQRICAAARDLFLDRGYAATTITEIARVAGVAHQTVYFVFGSKAAVLSAILDAEIVGDFDAVPVLDRPHVRRLRRIDDPVRRLRGAVAVSCDITHRVAPVYEIVRSGAIDAEVRDLLDRCEEQRWQTLRALVGMLDGELGGSVDVDEATDRAYALLSHEVYWLLVHQRHWSTTRWRRHVADEAVRQLLDRPLGPA